MSTSKEFHEYVMSRLSSVEGISSCRMMGEYVLFYKDKTFRNLCDNQLLLKPTETVLRLLPDGARVYPYEGSRTLMVAVDDPENTELLTEIIMSMYNELPEPKKKKRG